VFGRSKAGGSTLGFWEKIMTGTTTALRRLLAEESFIHLPVAYDALGGRLIEQTGFKAAYVDGFVTGGSRCTSEPQFDVGRAAAGGGRCG
jgi:hypothetical protein